MNKEWKFDSAAWEAKLVASKKEAEKWDQIIRASVAVESRQVSGATNLVIPDC